MRYTVIFDACVLYPAPLRDFLMRLSVTGLFAAKWTNQIHDEWIHSLLKKRPELKAALQRTRELMDQSVPDCLVSGYQPIINGLELPDPNDRHVLAAAIRCNAQAIITFNLKDFPATVLDPLGIETLAPDIFIEYQFELNPGLIITTAKNHRAALRNPPKSTNDYLETLTAQGLVVTAERLREFIELI